MPTQAQVVVLPVEPGPMRVEQVMLPDPGPHQVVLRLFASGVCHTQLHEIHNPVRPSPRVLGHEATGVVLARGSQVTHVGEGDRVMVTWVQRDRTATEREVEPFELALPGGVAAIVRSVFTWADHTILDEQFVVRLPDDVPTDITATIGCPVMTGAGAVYHTAGARRGDSVAVFGVGGVGLCAIAAAAVVEARPIIAVDLAADKLALARRFGATIGINAASGDPVEQIRALTGGGVDFALDCIGARATVQQALLATKPGVTGLRPGGTAVLVGAPQSTIEMDMRFLLNGGRTYKASNGGSCRPERDFPMFLQWYRDGLLDLNALVTRRSRLADINEVTAALERGDIVGRAILELPSA